jgi:hypothetical protein
MMEKLSPDLRCGCRVVLCVYLIFDSAILLLSINDLLLTGTSLFNGQHDDEDADDNQALLRMSSSCAPQHLVQKGLFLEIWPQIKGKCY